MPLQAGTRLGSYEVLDLIGTGGMGEVYRARDPRLSREVAIKVLPAHVAADEQRRRRFEAEAKAASRLNHPNVLTVHDVGDEGGTAWIAMELVEGPSLRERLASGPLSTTEAISIASQVAAALEAAHAHGIVHRDLKPENVMLRRDGLAKVVDFGLARSLAAPAPPDPTSSTLSIEGTAPGTILGTTPYMAPEQARGEPSDARSDQFSFGAVLYEMLSGRRAFAAPTPADTLAAVLTREPAPLDGVTPALPEALRAVVARCLAKDPAGRFPTTSALSAELRRLRDLVAVGATPPWATPPASASPWTSPTGPSPPASGAPSQSRWRGRRVPAGLALAGLGFAVAAVVGLPRLRKPPPAASLAVLPFAPGQPGGDLQYLGDGLTEGLINALSRRPGLRVTARTTAARYREAADPLAVARELGVDLVLTGRIEERAGRILVQADLLDAREGVQLWGQRYDRRTGELGAVEGEIAARVAERLRPAGGAGARALASTTTDAEAETLNLKGRFFLNRRDEASLRLAIEHFRQAAARDPEWAAPHAGLAAAHDVQAYMGYAPRDQAFTSARASAARALELDPDHPEALAVRAHVKARYEDDPEGAERDFRRALEVDPGTIDALHWYSHLLMDQERFPESLEHSLTALELDPLSAFINTHLGEHHLAAGQPEKALPPLRRAVELDPGYTYGQLFLGLAYVDLGRPQDALPPLRRAHELRPSIPRAEAFLGYALAVTGGASEARRILDDLRDASRQPPARPADLALVEIGLGLRDDALTHLRAALRDGTVLSWELRPRPFDAVRTELPDANAPAR